MIRFHKHKKAPKSLKSIKTQSSKSTKIRNHLKTSKWKKVFTIEMLVPLNQ